jgi:hypothetical protein
MEVNEPPKERDHDMHSPKRRFATASALVALSIFAPGCELFEGCDTHAPNYPVGQGPDSNYLYECRHNNGDDWLDAQGNVVLYVESGGLLAAACGPLDSRPDAEGPSGYTACEEMCEAYADSLHAVNVDCEVDIFPQASWDEAGMCDFYTSCDPDDIVMPGVGAVTDGDDESGVFCRADPNDPLNQDLDWDNGDADENPDFTPCEGCLLYTYSTEVVEYAGVSIPPPHACGFYVAVDEGQDATSACQDECYRLLQQNGGDTFLAHNCETFIVNESDECTMASVDPVGETLVWHTSDGRTETEALRCDGECCEELGVCELLRGDISSSRVPTQRLDAQQPATLRGAGETTDAQVHVAIEMYRANEGENVRPAYFETVAIEASFANDPIPTGTRNARGEPELVFGARAVLRRPVVGAVRMSTGELQVPEGSTYELTLDIGSAASRAVPRSSMYVSTSPLSGFIAQTPSGTSLELRGEIDVVRGVTLTLGR